MAIEEITLSVPVALPDVGRRRVVAACESVNPDDRAVSRYRRILQERHRFAWTRRGRRKRQEAFEVAYRSLVKQLAKDVTEPIGDRVARLDTRTRIYASLTGMLSVAAADQRRQRDQAHQLFGWGLALCGAGVCCLAATLFIAV